MHANVTRALALAMTLLLASALAATPAGQEGPRKETPAEALRKSLDHSITLELENIPLHHVLRQLGEMAKVNIVLDRNIVLALSDPADMPVNLKAKDMKLAAALRTVTGQHGLTFAIVGDHIFVSTEDIVNYRQLRQRVTFDLDGVALGSALRDLAQRTSTNLVVDPRSAKDADAAKVTLKLDDVPLETAVRLMSEMAGLKPVRLGNVMFVTTEDRAEKIKAEGESKAPPATLPAGGSPVNAPMILPAGPGQPAPAVPPVKM